ncbi:Type 1 glutamine amidotransferase-like domain-containing protein [Catenulispora pinisilvae]|uniref:Type 1 glutamine amidotransferase-like domain-containing protein n=1 Tax=Catenulispora pinisilvae TaxID=2705253 RepID=UPI0018926C88|nr:Type 1 glutamine amidotransferase-like domain-containing protein [Catenulispora pinisilvae]
MTGSVFLSGGGGAEDSAPLDSAFAAALGSGPLWYWPVAMDPAATDPAEQAYAGCLGWLTGVFGPLGVTDIDMWEGSGTGVAERLPDYRGVYIGGGNTFRLLDLVRRNGLLPSLQDFIEHGGVVYGGSAGAALLGADISTIAHMDPDPCGTTDTRGLDRIAGYGVFVHHRPSEVPRAQDWARENHRPVVALHERAGAVVTDGRLTSVGFEPVEIIGAGTLGVRSVRPGERVAL